MHKQYPTTHDQAPNGKHDHALPASRPRRLAVVARVSTREQEQHGTSLDDQARKGELLAQLHGMDVVPSDAYQGDESGALPLSARPIMQQLVADGRAGLYDAVCFHKIDRIARRLHYILEIWDALTDAGVTVYVIEPAIDTSTLMGRLLRNVLGTIAEFERDLLLERTAGGRQREVARGAVYHSRGKYGYVYVPRDSARGVLPGVREQPEQAEVVRRMYRLRARGYSSMRIAMLLTAEGIPSASMALGHKKTSPRWQSSTIDRIIADPAYRGAGQYGRRTTVRGRDGRPRLVPRTDGRAPQEVAYPALVTPEEWRAAQGPCAGERSTAVRADAGRYLLYGSMVRCAEHDRTMGGSCEKAGKRYYRCVRHLPTGGRTSHGLPALPLEEAVWDLVAGAMREPDLLLEAAERLSREAEGDMESIARRKAQIAARLEQLGRERRDFFTQMRAAGATAADMAEQARLMSEEEDRLHAELAPLAARMQLCHASLPRAEQVRAMCGEIAARLEGATPALKREVLEQLEVVVRVEGSRFRLEGVLEGLDLAGEVPVQTTQSSPPSGRVRGVPFVLCGDLAVSA